MAGRFLDSGRTTRSARKTSPHSRRGEWPSDSLDEIRKLELTAENWSRPGGGTDAATAGRFKGNIKPPKAAIAGERFGSNSDLIVPIEWAADLAPRAEKPDHAYRPLSVPRRDVPKKSP